LCSVCGITTLRLWVRRFVPEYLPHQNLSQALMIFTRPIHRPMRRHASNLRLQAIRLMPQGGSRANQTQEQCMQFRPLHERVAIKRIAAEAKSAGGIVIPETVKEKPSQGEIVAVGPGGRDENGKLIPIDLKIGERVLFGKWSGTEVKIDGDDILIMKESDIMGVLEEASPETRNAA
jgi:chaperonin GroES